MTAPAPGLLLRHRTPALLLGSVRDFDGAVLRCASLGDGPFPWHALLEGAAQCAGLLAGLQMDGLDDTAVIAEYRDVIVHTGGHGGPVTFVARLDRRVLRFWRCRVEVHAADEAILLQGLVTVAPRR